MAWSIVKRPVITTLYSFLLVGAALCQPPDSGQSSIPPKAHRATLSWAPSPDAHKYGSSLKYIVYRCDAMTQSSGSTECKGKFQKIAELDATKNTYTDLSVKAAHAYCYRVTSLVGHAESTASQTVVATIPAD